MGRGVVKKNDSAAALNGSLHICKAISLLSKRGVHNEDIWVCEKHHNHQIFALS